MTTIDLRPRLGRLQRKRADRFLFVCFFDPTGILTVCENIALWQRFSRYALEVLNLWPGRKCRYKLEIPPSIDLRDYAGLIVHCTVAYHPDNLDALDSRLARPLQEYDGIKILMKQDEHFLTGRVAELIGQKRFDLVLSCVPASERHKVYPEGVVGKAAFLQTYTGYVSPFMRDLRYGASAERPLDITYRGSLQPLSFGRLGFEKRQIGWEVGDAVAGKTLRTDISSRWEDRLSGQAWFDFLGRSRAVLGVESGANLFDYTGEVGAWCDEFIKANPTRDDTSKEFYIEADRLFLHRFEGNVHYAQISPRHFEAAATRSLQILYEGSYSGIFVPHRHYVPLRRDLTNLDEVIDFVRDDRRVSEMVECAFEEVILNPAFHYETFVDQVDRAIGDLLADKRQANAAAPIAFGKHRRRALLLAAHEATADPRVDWMAEGLSADFDVCELYMHADAPDPPGPSFERLSERRIRIRVARRKHDWEAIPDILNMPADGLLGLHHLTLLHVLAELPSKPLQRSIGALDAAAADLARFRWMARHFLDTNSAFIQAGRLLGEFEAVVAADLDTLPAALALGREYGAKVLYDAHEFWPYAFIEFRHWEVAFWSAFERNLATRADLRVTVSPQLAEVMAAEYGCAYLSVPNCVAKATVEEVDIDGALARMTLRDGLDFIFLGGFSPGRGIEDLIAAWRHVRSGARLILQGPDSPFKEKMIALARSLDLLDGRVDFREPVDSGELVRAARQADIGIIPYAPSSINNRYCSPNKLSQYMAAGLPIICNETEFVRSVVVGNGIGAAVDFKNHQDLARVIDEFAGSKEKIVAMSRRSRRVFETSFNWEQASAAMYRALAAAVADQPVGRRPELDFSWIAQGRDMRTSSDEFEDAQPIFADREKKRLAAEIVKSYQAHHDDVVRLNATINDLCRVQQDYAAEIGRLFEVVAALERNAVVESEAYSAQTERLNGVIAELQHRSAAEAAAHTAGLKRLDGVIAELQHRSAAEAAAHTAELARLNEIINTLQEQAPRRWIAAIHRRFRTPRIRGFARAAAAPLPPALRSRIRSGLVLILHRF